MSGPGRETAALLAGAVAPHAEAIAEIAEREDVAVVLHEIAPEHEAHFRATFPGYPETQVFPLPKRLRKRLRNLPGDPTTRRWLDSPREGVARVLLFIHAGSVLLNFHPDRGWWVEAGSTDGGSPS